jgi:hypothetical protein
LRISKFMFGGNLGRPITSAHVSSRSSRGPRCPAATFAATASHHGFRRTHFPMSLFGGASGSAPPSQQSVTGSESEPSSPSIDGRASPPSAQHHYATESAEDDNLLTDSESEEEDSERELPVRPNRFQGQPSVWKRYTAADRQTAASLEQLRNQDLAAHLYNAHALKHRVRRPAEDLAQLKNWQSREHWLKRGKDLEYMDVSGEVQTELVPAKDWTAWPLPPPRTSTLHNQPRRYVGSANNGWTVGGTGVQDAAEELREELLATFLRSAKERWNARQPDDTPIHEGERTTQSRSRSRSKSARSARSASSSKNHIKIDDDSQTDDAEKQHEDEQKFGHIIAKRGGRATRPETFLKPTFLVDDNRAQRTLEPVINSVLSKLDDLALAVRRTRLNHFGRGADSDMSSYSEFTSGAESSEPSSRPISRSQSRPRQSRKRSARPVSRPMSAQYRSASIKARINTQNNPSASATDSSSDSGLDIKNEKSTTRPRPSRRTSTESERKRSPGRDDGRVGLMDWSEVLGLAAAKGWNEGAVSRTAQRCAALFGESMSLVPLDESIATKPPREPVHYTPSTIPAPDPSLMRPSKRPYFRPKTLRCPHVDCYGHEKDFEAPYRVVQHCIRNHGYDPRTNDSDNEERTVGGVHIDGFLQPIEVQPGWVQRGKSRASSEKRERKHEGYDADDAMIIDSD